MARLAQTAGLTDVQSEILATVRQFVDKEVIPHAQELEHADTYPADIVEGMKEMGLFGITIRRNTAAWASRCSPTRSWSRRSRAAG